MANILIGCEFSGITRDAFIARGHNAISCDLEPSERCGPHLQCDVFRAMRVQKWDLIILHPPCTYMAVSGNRWYAGTNERMHAEQWTAHLWIAAFNQCERVALENPVSTLANAIGPSQQTIQPHEFGHGEVKRICWWLHNLPPLLATDNVEGREERVWRMPPSAERARERSRWYEGIAAAEAEQWGDLL